MAFFPLYPLLARAGGWLLGGRYLVAGLLLSSLFLFAALAYMYKLVAADFGEDAARRATWLIALFPTSVFFTAFYTESLFLLTSVAAFYYGRRNRWALAGVWGLMASMTRVVGLLLLVPLAYEYLSQRSFSPLKSLRPVVLWLTLIPGGLVLYMGYLYFGFGRPLAFAEAQTVGWGHEFTPSLTSFVHDVSFLVDKSIPTAPEMWVIYDIAAMLLLIGVILAGVKQLPRSYTIYMVLSLPLPLAGGSTKAMSRYLLVVFPIFIVLALMTRRRPVWLAVVGVSLVLMAVASAAFATGRWVA
jgi:Gpi18-like mannosyltransferase